MSAVVEAAEAAGLARRVARLRPLNMNCGSDEHLRAILECFDLKRLTTQVGTALLEILDRPNE